ncbi:efflux RND transporter periplasmic adaptor subunit [uncultured Rhodoblastus sp.]|uniref:efflux RND transporter periplasmic adaptor subunit n=1 Tax=uncultured Rhodoblastus sp. TaxID=543037 RepID=UPI0025E5AA7A|nr:efflux RND transporter periplasmic adaptor subunit [uncultured Rhodoblastus sp.]
MSSTKLEPVSGRARAPMLPVLLALALAMAGCKSEKAAEAPPPRPVRTVIAEKSELGQSVVLTGQILAEKEVALAFRIGGRIIERKADVGNRVTPNQVLAKLDPQNELNGLRSARAALSAAEGRLAQDSNNFERQQTLLNRGFTTRVLFDQAEQALRTSRAQVDDAKAQLHIAEDRVSYTELRSDVAGTITARRAESGEVVQAGQMVFQVARDSGWDAVFAVPAQVIRSAPSDAVIVVSLTDDPTVTARGHVRQVDPQADPITRTFKVRVSVNDPPAAMRLGAVVTGRMDMESAIGIAVPATALTALNGAPALWLVDPANMTVKLHPVEVLRFDPGTVVISGGLEGGEIVVTAGVQALHPDQKVRLIEARS